MFSLTTSEQETCFSIIAKKMMVSNFNDDGEDLKFEKVKAEISKSISNVIPNSSNQVDLSHCKCSILHALYGGND